MSPLREEELIPAKHPNIFLLGQTIRFLMKTVYSVPFFLRKKVILMNSLIFLHGLGSSPEGTKACFLKKLYPYIKIPPLSADPLERLYFIENYIKEPSILIGSSLGGLTSIMFCIKHPDFVKSLLLLAPAVWTYDQNILKHELMETLVNMRIPDGIPTTIIAAEKDEVIPLEKIREFSKKTDGINLLEVDDTHDLHNSFDLIKKKLQCIILNSSAPK